MSTLIVKNLDAPTGESIVAPDLTLPQGAVIQVTTGLVGGQVSFSNVGTESFVKEFAYTPTSSTSKLYCQVHVAGISNGGSGRLELRLRVDTVSGSGSNGDLKDYKQVALDGAGTAHLGACSLSTLTSALGDTNTRYFKLFGNKHDNSSTWYINQYDGSPLSFTVMEIAG